MCCRGGSAPPSSQTVQSTTVQKADPWAGQQPFLSKGFERAADVLERPREFFPGQTFPSFDPRTEAALGAMETRAAGGSPISTAGRDEYLSTVRGDYVDQPNPAFDAVAERIRNIVTPQVQSTFARAGGHGSDTEAEIMARSLADAVAPYAFQTYETERGRQYGAAGAAPQYAQTDYLDIGQLGRVGEAYESQDAARIAEEMQRHQFEQNIEAQQLADYMAMIGGVIPGGGTTTSSQGIDPRLLSQSDPFGNLLGVGSLGLGAWNAGLFGGPSMIGAAGLPAGASLVTGLPWLASAAAPAAASTALPAAAASLAAFSHSSLKREVRDVEPRALLAAARKMKVRRWRYEEFMQDSEEHVGPYAEDFQEATGLGDGTTIEFIDAFGVLLGAVQALAAEVDDLKARLRDEDAA